MAAFGQEQTFRAGKINLSPFLQWLIQTIGLPRPALPFGTRPWQSVLGTADTARSHLDHADSALRNGLEWAGFGDQVESIGSV